MKTNRIEWASGRGNVSVNDAEDEQLSDCDGAITEILRARGVEVKNDWDSYFQCAADVSDADLEAIRATAGAKTQTARIVTCSRCGCTNLRGAMFTTLASQSICDDCA